MTTALPAAASAQTEDPLRYAFVEMLFALAISQVAISVADLTLVTGTFDKTCAAWAHLGLSLIVIGASWVGWRLSQSPGMKAQIGSIFSRRAFGLLLDVILVILYFVLARSVELKQDNGVTTLTPASASVDARWVAAIFCVYVVWDLFADVFSPGSLTETGWKGVWQAVRVACASTAASAVCVGLSLAVMTLSTNVTEPTRVALFDGGLISIVLLFRALKAFENAFAGLLGVGACKAFQSGRSVSSRPVVLALALLAIGTLCVALADHWTWFYAEVDRLRSLGN
jgi:hypothetical protein